MASCFEELELECPLCRLTLELACHELADIPAGLERQMQAKTFKWYKEVGGLLLSFRGLRRLCDKVRIMNDNPAIIVPVKCWALFFAPAAGKQIDSTVVDSSESQINLLHLGLVPVSVTSDRVLSRALSYSGGMWQYNGKPLKNGQVLRVVLDEVTEAQQMITLKGALY